MNFDNSILTNINLAGANLEQATLRWTCLTKVNMSHSILRNTTLCGTLFEKLSLTETDLTGSTINNDTAFIEVTITESQLLMLLLGGWQLSPAQMRGIKVIQD